MNNNAFKMASHELHPLQPAPPGFGTSANMQAVPSSAVPCNYILISRNADGTRVNVPLVRADLLRNVSVRMPRIPLVEGAVDINGNTLMCISSEDAMGSSGFYLWHSPAGTTVEDASPNGKHAEMQQRTWWRTGNPQGSASDAPIMAAQNVLTTPLTSSQTVPYQNIPAGFPAQGNAVSPSRTQANPETQDFEARKLYLQHQGLFRREICIAFQTKGACKWGDKCSYKHYDVPESLASYLQRDVNQQNLPLDFLATGLKSEDISRMAPNARYAALLQQKMEQEAAAATAAQNNGHESQSMAAYLASPSRSVPAPLAAGSPMASKFIARTANDPNTAVQPLVSQSFLTYPDRLPNFFTGALPKASENRSESDSGGGVPLTSEYARNLAGPVVRENSPLSTDTNDVGTPHPISASRGGVEAAFSLLSVAATPPQQVVQEEAITAGIASPVANVGVRATPVQTPNVSPQANATPVNVSSPQHSAPTRPRSTTVSTTLNSPTTLSPNSQDKLVKTHCTYFLRYGECDFMQQGCKFSHERPEVPIVRTVGDKPLVAVPSKFMPPGLAPKGRVSGRKRSGTKSAVQDVQTPVAGNVLSPPPPPPKPRPQSYAAAAASRTPSSNRISQQQQQAKQQPTPQPATAQPDRKPTDQQADGEGWKTASSKRDASKSTMHLRPPGYDEPSRSGSSGGVRDRDLISLMDME